MLIPLLRRGICHFKQKFENNEITYRFFENNVLYW